MTGCKAVIASPLRSLHALSFDQPAMHQHSRSCLRQPRRRVFADAVCTACDEVHLLSCNSVTAACAGMGPAVQCRKVCRTDLFEKSGQHASTRSLAAVTGDIKGALLAAPQLLPPLAGGTCKDSWDVCWHACWHERATAKLYLILQKRWL